MLHLTVFIFKESIEQFAVGNWRVLIPPDSARTHEGIYFIAKFGVLRSMVVQPTICQNLDILFRSSCLVGELEIH